MSEILFLLLLAVANAAVIARLAPAFAARYGDRTLPRLLLIGWSAPFIAAAFPDPLAIPALTFGAVSALLDARHRRLPLELTALMLAEWLLLAIIVTVDWPAAVAGCAIWTLPLAFGALVRQVGWGDVLFAVPLGLWVGAGGVQVSLGGLGAALVAAGIWSSVARGRGGRRVPLGPFLWAGAVAAWAVDMVSA